MVFSSAPLMPLALPLDEQTLVLTVNTRLARHLEIEDARARNLTHTAWTTPRIHPLPAWMQDAWTQSWPDRAILSVWQRNLLWESILEADAGFRQLDPLSMSRLAEQAAEAYTWIQEYRLFIKLEDFKYTPEWSSFYNWQRVYAGFLEERRALDPSQVPDAVHHRMQAGDIPLPQKLVLAGFDEINPQLQRWTDFLKSRGVGVDHYPEFSPDSDASWKSTVTSRAYSLKQFEDPKQEAMQCARWVRSVFKPGDTIGIVALRMEDYRDLLQRELSAELVPESVLAWAPWNLPINISLGGGLAQEPMVRSALMVLTAPSPPLPLDTFTQCIRSPYLNATDTGECLAEDLELRLRKRKALWVSPLQALALIQPGQGKKKRESRQFKSLKNLVRQWQEYLATRKNQNSLFPSQWSSRFAQTLAQIGWPGSHRKLNSREIQAHEAWLKCLDTLASLNASLGRLPRSAAANYLERIVTKTLFQENNPEQPVQVLGWLEAAGHRFDHLWVMGCHAEALPPAPVPNPFLPIKMQKSHALPRASITREFTFSRTVLTRLLHASPDLVFSYPASDGNQPLQPCPLLLEGSPSVEGPDAMAFPIEKSSRLKDLIKTASMETLVDTRLLPPAADELQSIQGGFRIFKSQGDCPFRAFALHRLLADRIDPPELDYDRVDRGNLVHKILELFWKKVRTLSALRRLAEDGGLDSLVRRTVRTAMESRSIADKWDGQPRFRQMEEDRVFVLTMEWLEKEMERSEFSVVSQEKKVMVSFCGLNLQLRPDRIDEWDDGRRLLIDYKTGNVNTGNWFRKRIPDPQLPLYACHLNPDGIAFSQIKKGDLKFKAAVNPDIPMQGAKLETLSKVTECQTWEELLSFWRRELDALGREFKEGQVQVHPNEGDQTCRWCHLKTLCRIPELKERVRSEAPES
ncbi:MAG: PD-(D/E)XK nuclease family protein [Nitrospinaceae bacterium]